MRLSEKVSWALVAVLVGVVAFGAYKFVTGSVAKGEDGRTVVLVTKDERQFVLNEMRNWLASVQATLDATSRGDFAAAAEAASAAGMAAEQGTPAQLLAKIPIEMKALGMDTRARFDQIAATALSSKDAAATTAKLSEAMNNCIACHATYSFSSGP